MKRRYKPSVFRDVCDGQSYSDLGLTRLKLFKSSKNSLGMVQRLDLMKRLPVHNGCVNSICWNETGNCILSGSDDQHIVVSHGFNHKVLTDFKTSHRANIFSAKFLPGQGDRHIVSCSGDGIILFTDLNRPHCTSMNQFSCHSGTTYDVITVPSDPYSFLSCGEDGTVRWFDLRIKDKCRKSQCKEDILITCQRAVTSLSVNPTAPYQLAVGCSDSRVRLFDRRMLGTEASGFSEGARGHNPLSTFTAPSLRERSCRITSLHYSPDGQEILVSFSSDLLYLFSMKDREGNGNSSADCDIEGPSSERTPAPVRRLRLRGDWSDTGPNARPEREGNNRGPTEFAQSRRTLHASLMQRMTDVLARMLNDPATRANLNSGRQESRPEDADVDAGNAPAANSADSSPDPTDPPDAAQRPNEPTEPREAPHSPMFPFDHPLNESFAVNPFLPLDSPLSPESPATTDHSSPPPSDASMSDDEQMVQNVVDSDPCVSRTFPDVVIPDSPMSPDAMLLCNVEGSNVAGAPMSPDAHNVERNFAPDSPISDPEWMDTVADSVDVDSPMSPDPVPAHLTSGSPMSPDPTLPQFLRDSPMSPDIGPVIQKGLLPDSSLAPSVTPMCRTRGNLEDSSASSISSRCVSDSISMSCLSNECTTCVKPLSTTVNGNAPKSSAISNPSSSSSISNLLQKCVEPHPLNCSSGSTDSLCSLPPTQSCGNTNNCSMKTDISESPMSPDLRCPSPSDTPSTSDIPREPTPELPTSTGRSCVPARDPATDCSSSGYPTDDDPLPGTSSDSDEGTAGTAPRPGEASAFGDPRARMALVDPSLDDNFRRDSPLSPTVPTENVAVQVSDDTDSSSSSSSSEDEFGDGPMLEYIRQDMEMVLDSNSSEEDVRQQFPQVMFPRSRHVMIPPVDEMQLRNNEELIDTLHSMRDRHAVEPAVLLSVSEVTDAGAAFAVRVATDDNRGPPHIPYLIENQRNPPVQRPSVPPPIPPENEAFYNNEEAEDDTPNVRLIHPIEREMDSAIAEARSLGVLAEEGCTFQPSVRQIFSGHRNARTMIKEACFWGTDYVMSGSDCGHVFVWERNSGRLVQLFEGDEHVVNCLQPHPTLPILATSGIDYDVKLWAPLAADMTFDHTLAELLKKRNEIMLEETKDTITVPATFMIRMLACLNQIRRGGRRPRRPDDESNE